MLLNTIICKVNYWPTSRQKTFVNSDFFILINNVLCQCDQGPQNLSKVFVCK